MATNNTGAMDLEAAFAEVAGIQRVLKTFALAEQVLAAAVTASKTQQEKDRLLAETQAQIDAAQRQVRAMDAELAKSIAGHRETLQAEVTAAQQAHAEHVAKIEAAAKELATQEQAVEAAKKAAAAALATLAETQAKTAALIAAEEKKVQDAGAAKLAELNAQAYTLQSTIDALKLQLRTTMDSAGRLL